MKAALGGSDQESVVDSDGSDPERDYVKGLAQRATLPDIKAQKAKGPFVVSCLFFRFTGQVRVRVGPRSPQRLLVASRLRCAQLLAAAQHLPRTACTRSRWRLILSMWSCLQARARNRLPREPLAPLPTALASPPRQPQYVKQAHKPGRHYYMNDEVDRLKAKKDADKLRELLRREWGRHVCRWPLLVCARPAAA